MVDLGFRREISIAENTSNEAAVSDDQFWDLLLPGWAIGLVVLCAGLKWFRLTRLDFELLVAHCRLLAVLPDVQWNGTV